jgi:hypothetical protein
VTPARSYLGVTLAVVAALAVIGLLVLGTASGCKAWVRYQHRADAENAVRVSAIQIRNQAQRVKIAQQQAEIKHQTAIGQRLANEEIARRLTPLFVQYEMIESLKAIAASGKNNSVVYIPSGANGVPLVSVSNQPQVYGGQVEPEK